MKLMQIVTPAAIVPKLRGFERDAVITELIDQLVSSGGLPAAMRDEIIRLILQRERHNSTGFGKGVAVPHVKHKDVRAVTATIGLSERGVDFNALDRQPVHTIFLLLSPEHRPDDHLQAMEVIFKSLSKDTFRRYLRQARTVDEVVTLLEEADNQTIKS